MGWGRGLVVFVRAVASRVRAVMVVVIAVASVVLPGISAQRAHAATIQTLSVPADAVHGVDSAPLSALSTYLITASGSFTYGAFRNGAARADAECTTNPDSALAPVASWLRARYASFYTENPPLLVASEFWDPDPTDDATDVYVDHKNVEWLPTTPSITGCNETDHTYTTIYVPSETRPVNFGVFDIGYGDNFGGVTITIQQLSLSPPLPALGRHTETVLVNAADQAGSSTAPLRAGREYLFITHGTWIYNVNDVSSIADTECARTPSYPVYLRHAFGNDPLDVVVNGSPIEWHGLGPETDIAGLQGCNSPSHIYWYIGTGHGVPINLSIADTNYADNEGVISVDVYQLDGTRFSSFTKSAHPSEKGSGGQSAGGPDQ